MVTVLDSTAQSSTARAGLPGMLGDHVRQTRSVHSPPVTAPTSHCPDCGAPQLGDLLLEESGHPEEEEKTESPQPGGTSVRHRCRWLDNLPVTREGSWDAGTQSNLPVTRLLFLCPPPSDSSQVPPVPHCLSTLSTASLPVFVFFSFFLFLPLPLSLSPATPSFSDFLSFGNNCVLEPRQGLVNAHVGNVSSASC